MADPYLIPGLPDPVLRNRENITDPQELDDLERLHSSAGEALLQNDPLPPTFDRAHISAIHEELFGETYEWAGRMRDERFTLSDGAEIGPVPILSKGGHAFAFGQHIDGALDRLSKTIRAPETLKQMNQDQFVKHAAYAYAELNAIHPFREGNGRTQRVFLNDIAREAGRKLDWTVIDGERNIRASIESSTGSNRKLEDMFRDMVQDDRREMLQEAASRRSQNSNLQWMEANLNFETQTLRPGEAISGTLVDRSDTIAQIMTDDNRLVIAQSKDLTEDGAGARDTAALGSPMAGDSAAYIGDRTLDAARRAADNLPPAQRDAINAKLDALEAKHSGTEREPSRDTRSTSNSNRDRTSDDDYSL